MKPERLQGLRELAQQATPGPWGYCDTGACEIYPILATGDERDIPAIAYDASEPNAQFIAAASPSTIIALLDRIAELSARLEAQ